MRNPRVNCYWYTPFKMHLTFVLSICICITTFLLTQNADEYKTLNPMAQVPSLVIGDNVLTQSVSNKLVWYMPRLAKTNFY